MFLNKYSHILVLSLLIFSINAMEKPDSENVGSDRLISLYQSRSREKPCNLLLQAAKCAYDFMMNGRIIHITILPTEVREQIVNVQIIEESTLSKKEKKWAYYIIDNNLIPPDLLIQNLKEKNFEPPKISFSICGGLEEPTHGQAESHVSFKDIINLLNCDFEKINMSALNLSLFCAVTDNKLALVKLLISSGVNILNLISINGFRSIAGLSIFDIGCLSSKCSAQTLEYIIDIAQQKKLNLNGLIKKERILKGLVINDQDKIQCLFSLAKHLNITIDQEISSYSGRCTPLILSIALGYDNAVKLLLENGANNRSDFLETFNKEYNCNFSNILDLALCIIPDLEILALSNEELLKTINLRINIGVYPENYLYQKLNIIDILKNHLPDLVDCKKAEMIDHYRAKLNELIELDETQKAIDLSLGKENP